MKRNTILTAAALFAAALFILDVPAVKAQSHYFRATSGNSWNTAGNWFTTRTGFTGAGLPGTGSYVEIVDLANNRCDIDTADREVARIDVLGSGNGQLDIFAGRKLSLNGSNPHTITGTLNLLGSGTATLHFKTNSVTVDGSGAIDGQDNAARIEVAANLTLTSTTTIEGNLLITEPAAGAANTKFVNNGHVRANNASGTLELSMDSLEVSSGGWWCSASNAVLKLNYGSSAGTHSGKFTILEGTLDVVKSCTTSGDLEVQEGGQVNVAAGETFTGCN